VRAKQEGESEERSERAEKLMGANRREARREVSREATGESESNGTRAIEQQS